MGTPTRIPAATVRGGQRRRDSVRSSTVSDDGGPRLPTDFNAWMAAEFKDRPSTALKARRSWRSSRTRDLDAWQPSAPARRRRVWWTWAVVVAVVAALIGLSLAFPSEHRTATRTGTADGGQGRRPTAPPAPVPTAPVGPMPTVDELFPVHVAAGRSAYDRIATLTSDHCLHNDAIPQQLADTIQELGGCIGGRFALYVDTAHHA